MYLSFYGLKIKPFQNSTNPSFCWLGETHKEALVIFKYGILEMPGVFLLTGDVGTGKTILVNVLINRLGSDFIVVKVPDPGLDVIDFVNYLSDSLGFKKKFTSEDSFIAHFSQFLGQAASVDQKILLIIDECQRLNSHLLEEIIKLSNIETVGKKTLKVLLIGQNDFSDVVKKGQNSALDQLITIKYAITPLDLSETGEFVKHRLKIAGAKKTIFSPDAITKIYQFSAGIPRRINIICDHALLSGFRQRAKIINGNLVCGCAEDLCPPGFSPDRNTDFPDVCVSAQLKKTPPDSRKKTGSRRAGKIFAAVMFITIPLSLVVNFTDQTKYRDLSDHIKTKESQIVSTNNREEKRDSKISLTPDAEKVSSQIDSIKTITPLSNELMSEEDSLEISDKKRPANEDDEDVVSVVAPSEDNKTDEKLEATINSIPANDIPANETVGTVVVDVPDGGPEITRMNDTADIAASEENVEADTDFFDKQSAVKLNSTPGEDTNQVSKIELPDSLVRPDKSEEAKAIVDEQPEDVDPGAVIDWVIKKRSK